MRGGLIQGAVRQVDRANLRQSRRARLKQAMTGSSREESKVSESRRLVRVGT
jgi:hypothetical protein